MDEIKYRNLFVGQMCASATDYDKELKRVIKENGYSEELKKDFYFAAFDSIIAFNKNTLIKKDKFYKDNIIRLYNLFIYALKSDGVDYSSIEEKRNTFEQKEFPLVKLEKDYPPYKAYNPNTKYGRKKALEQARRNYVNGSDDYRNDINNIKIVVWGIVIIIAILFFFIKAKLES